MTQAKFISSEPKSGMSAEEMRDLENKTEAVLKRANELNSDNLEIKAEMALKNKFISSKQEKELFELVNDSDTLFTRYNNGERTEDLLAGLEKHCQALEQKRNEIFPDASKGARLKLAEKKEAGVDDKNETASAKKQPTKDGKEAFVEQQKQKEELIDKLDAAYKELYGFLNEKKEDTPKDLYKQIKEIEDKLRGTVKFRGEVADIVEKMKEKYKKDERSEEEKAKKEKKIVKKDKDIAEQKPGKKSGFTKQMVEARATEIKQRRIEGNQPGFEWEKIDALLRENKIEPGTPEADKFMAEWDKKTARQELVKEEKQKKAAEAIIQPTLELEEKSGEKKKDSLRITPKDSGETKKEEVEKSAADLGVAGKSQSESKKEKQIKSEVDWDKSAIMAVEGGWQPESKVDMSKSAIIAAEAGGLKIKAEEEQKIGPEEIPVESTETAGEPEKESQKVEIEAALVKAREDYVAAELAKDKADKAENKLTGIRAILGKLYDSFDEIRTANRESKIDAVKAEADAALEKYLKAKQDLKAAIRAYRDNEVIQIDKKAVKLKTEGKTEEEIKKETDKYAEGILLATTMGEAAKMDSLKSAKQIEQMGKARRFINEKAEEFTEWYKKLPLKGKIAVSAGLTVAGVAGGLVGSTAIITATFAGQTALRVLGGSLTTAGLEKLFKGLGEKEEKRYLSNEFSGKFLETLKNQDDKLNERLFEMVKKEQARKNIRFAIAGAAGAMVGSGVFAQMLRDTFSAHFGKTGGLEGVDNTAVKSPGTSDVMAEADIIPLGEPPGAEQLTPEAAMEASGGLKEPGEIVSLEIGSRGPEGAIIDNFKAKPDLAKAFGWDGETDIKKWAGTKAHQLWLKSVEGELAKPGMADKLTSQGFTVDAEGYAKAMHKLGKGFVELDPQGHIHLSDNTNFLRAGAPALEELGGAEHVLGAIESPAPEAPAPETPTSMEGTVSSASEAGTSLSAEDLIDQKIKATVTRFVDPTVLSDKTFKAAAKTTIGKLLEEVPAEAYKDKYALSNYWHSLSEIGVKTPKLPGTGFLGDLSYDDWRKYTEMAKLLRENPVLKGVTGLKNMNMGEFFHLYGGDLGKK
ncbi:hypothetical protein KJ866_04480 [Patescibacteria group bacterium]|nr:hypothetical protein [Patescibacteria group bacterium]